MQKGWLRDDGVESGGFGGGNEELVFQFYCQKLALAQYFCISRVSLSCFLLVVGEV